MPSIFGSEKCRLLSASLCIYSDVNINSLDFSVVADDFIGLYSCADLFVSCFCFL